MSTRARRLGRMLLVLGGLHQAGTADAMAQEPAGVAGSEAPLTVSASFDGASWVRADSSITLALSRLPSASDGRLAVAA